MQTLKDLYRKYEDNKKEVNYDEKLEQSYLSLRNDFERLHSVVQELADALDCSIPTFEIEEDKSKQTQMVIKKKAKVDETDEFFPFDDELQFKFYRDLPDLSRFVVDKEQTSSGAITGSSDADVDDMTKKLLKSQSKDLIDEKVTDFLKQNCYVQLKSGRKKMARALFNVPRNSLSLLPYYSRFTATTHQYFK